MITRAQQHVTQQPRARARAKGTGHRKQYSKGGANRGEGNVSAHISRSYADADRASLQYYHHHHRRSGGSQEFEFGSNDLGLRDYDDEREIVALRKSCALSDEAQTTVSESRKLWLDAPFSLFAIHYGCFSCFFRVFSCFREIIWC